VTGDVILARIAPAALVAVRGVNSIPLDVLGGERVLAFAGVGDPSSFFAQLRQLGAVVTGRRFGDHHAYTAADVGRLTGQYAGHKYAVTTEKDAVKLSTLWPATGPELWYLSQAVRITEGEPLLASALAKLFQRATSIA
jgi:tetraacyldisaccharide 4'-kinase